MLREPNVLIVEDYFITALDLSNVLQNLGFKISGIAKTAEEAIEKAELYKPDLIMMDIMLKGHYSGIDTARFIKEQSSTPIIFLTALKDDDTFLSAYQIKPAAFLHKPFNEIELKDAINKALKHDKISY